MWWIPKEKGKKRRWRKMKRPRKKEIQNKERDR